MKKTKKQMKPITRSYRDIWRLRPSALLSMLVTNAIAAGRPFVNIIIPARLIDELSGGRDAQILITLALTGVLLNLALALVSSWMGGLSDISWEFLSAREKNSVSEKLLRMDYARLEHSEFAAKVAQHRDEATREGSVYCLCLWLVHITAKSLTTIALAAVAMRHFWKLLFTPTGQSFLESKWLGLAMLASMVFIIVFTMLLSGKLNAGSAVMRKEYADISRVFEHYKNMLTDYKTGKEVRLFKQQGFILRQATDEMVTRGVRLQVKISNRYAVGNGLSAVTFSLLATGFYLLVGLKARAGLYTVGDMVIYIGAFLQLAQAFSDLTMVFGRLKSVAPKAALYYQILDTPLLHQTGDALPAPGAHTIECKNLCFQYEEGADFGLRDVCITLRPGDRIAIVGENGSGKTTFIKLLCRLYDISQGEILLDGVNIRAYDEEAYRGLFSVVFQDYHIFSLPLGENVASRQDYDEGRARHWLEEVGFPGKVDLKTCLYKDCDKEGVEISGGESQKLALARALYKDAPFIILDEPTAALDPIAEFALYSKFNGLVGDKTAIYISHRLSSCRFCDKIAVFEHGRLTQFGAHEELVRDERGKYYELWNAQAKYYM